MISTKEMNELGLPSHPMVMPLAMKTVNKALVTDADPFDIMKRLGRVIADPHAMLNDSLFGHLAEAVL